MASHLRLLTTTPVPDNPSATSTIPAAPHIPRSTSCMPLLDLFSLTSCSRSQANGKVKASPNDTVSIAAGKIAIQSYAKATAERVSYPAGHEPSGTDEPGTHVLLARRFRAGRNKTSKSPLPSRIPMNDSGREDTFRYQREIFHSRRTTSKPEDSLVRSR